MASEPARGRQLLSGWGRTAPSLAQVAYPRSEGEVAALVAKPGRRGLIARGLGRSYGDAAQRGGGLVIDLRGLDRIHGFDPATGVVECDAGVSLETLMRVFLPRGWFVPVTPGTRFVSVGGAIAADIHGKNHHHEGGFARHVRQLRLVTPSGAGDDLGPGSGQGDGSREARLFWATAGGMGLTGVVSRARLALLPVETTRIRVDTERLANLDDLMAAMDSGDDRYRYSVAWVDCLATGRRLGRSVLTRGDHAGVDELAADQRSPASALAFSPASRLEAPARVPGGLLNRATVRGFNELWYRKAPRHEVGRIEELTTFFHPLDLLGGWNRLYGPRGFVQYQLVVPFGAEDTLRLVLERLAGAGVASFLAVLKRFGAAAGPLSFPMAGWTLALDLPAGPAGLGALLDDLDAKVAEAGGRVYLAKDARLRPEMVAAMYPRLDQWRAVRDQADPDRVLGSDLSARLGLLGGPASASVGP